MMVNNKSSPGKAIQASTKRCAARSDFPPEESGSAADQDSDHHIECRRGQTDHYRNTSPVEKAAQQVSPQVVGPQEILGGWGLHDVGQVYFPIGIRCQTLGKESDDNQDQDENPAGAGFSCHSDEENPGASPAMFSLMKKSANRPRRLDSLIPYSRIQIGINQVDEEIEQHHPGGEKQVGSLDHRVVTALQGIQHETPEPRQGKDVLHDHRASDQDRQLQANQGHHRDEGIFEGVPDNHDLLPEPLGPGGADIILPQHLQHHGAHHAHGCSRRGRPQNQAGDEEPPEIPQRVFAERDVFQRWGPTPPDGGVDHHHDGQPEVRRGQADDGQGAPRVVGERILAYRRVDTHRQRDHEPNDDGQQAKLNGDRQSGEYLLLYRPVAPQGLAQAAVPENLADPASILHPDRHVQSQPTLESFTVYIATHPLHLTQHGVYDVAGDEAHREKDEDAQEKQGGDDQQ